MQATNHSRQDVHLDVFQRPDDVQRAGAVEGGYNYNEKLPWLHGQSGDEMKSMCIALCMIPRRSQGWNKMFDHSVENIDHKSRENFARVLISKHHAR